MGERTGRPRGRPPGAKNKRTEERERQVAEASERISEALGVGAFEGDAHALLMSVYKDPGVDLNMRVDAAKAAIRFEKPALAATTMDADVQATVRRIELVGVRPSDEL